MEKYTGVLREIEVGSDPQSINKAAEILCKYNGLSKEDYVNIDPSIVEECWDDKYWCTLCNEKVHDIFILFNRVYQVMFNSVVSVEDTKTFYGVSPSNLQKGDIYYCLEFDPSECSFENMLTKAVTQSLNDRSSNSISYFK